jgi:hypothetical protein
MSDSVPVVRIACGSAPGGFYLLNEADYEPATMTLFDDVQFVPFETPIAAKGPRGLWYLMKDGQRISRGFDTEAEALASVSA